MAAPPPVPSADTQLDVTRLQGSLSKVQGSSTLVGQQDGALIEDCAAGNVDACTSVLNGLAQECFDGDGQSCDTLYWVSPVGTEYESYGATCGGRFAWEYVGQCGQL
ncbi:hypothetical protein [Geodermatophilus sp. SYSU D01105]